MAQKGIATLNLNDGSAPIELPILSGTMGHDVVDIRALHAKSGLFTYDPGYLSTASNSSNITLSGYAAQTRTTGLKEAGIGKYQHGGGRNFEMSRNHRRIDWASRHITKFLLR